jgi:hypothetical protein
MVFFWFFCYYQVEKIISETIVIQGLFILCFHLAFASVLPLFLPSSLSSTQQHHAFTGEEGLKQLLLCQGQAQFVTLNLCILSRSRLQKLPLL